MRLWPSVVKEKGSNKKKGETYLFLESRKAKSGYGLSFDDRTLDTDSATGRSQGGLVSFNHSLDLSTPINHKL